MDYNELLIKLSIAISIMLIFYIYRYVHLKNKVHDKWFGSVTYYLDRLEDIVSKDGHILDGIDITPEVPTIDYIQRTLCSDEVAKRVGLEKEAEESKRLRKRYEDLSNEQDIYFRVLIVSQLITILLGLVQLISKYV